MKSKRLHSKKNNRKTKRKYGGNFFQNVFVNLFKDKNVNKNYYETEIVVKDKTYKINYFAPSNTILLKSTDSLWTPKFNLTLNEIKYF
jgi:ABC-type polar amino acid transport system ATPase subunit